MAITGIHLFHQNSGHLVKQLTVTCSCLSLVFTYFITMQVIWSNNLQSHVHGYHLYSFLSSKFWTSPQTTYSHILMPITSIHLFHENSGHLLKQVRVTCSCLSLVFISFIKILVIWSNKLESHAHAYHWYSVISSQCRSSGQTTYSHMCMAITGIHLFHQNSGHLLKQVRVTCSCLSLVFIYFIKILVICSNKLESHAHAYHWYSFLSSKFWSSGQKS